MLYLLGLNHRSASVEVRERLFFPPEELREVLPELSRDAAVSEAMILSTCNRTELIVSASSGEDAARALEEFLARRRSGQLDALARHSYTLQGLEAARHIFRVASSLDSMIVGEPQILGQVKEAYALATGAGTVGPVLSGLMQRSFSCAKRIRTDTGIARHPVSVAYAAAELADQIFGSLEDRSILLLGAGKMGKLTARHLARKGVSGLLVASRTFDNAMGIARDLGGEAVNFDGFLEHMGTVDIVIASTAAPHYIMRLEDGPGIMKARRNRPLFIVDLAVPRNMDPALNNINNLFLYNIDALQRVADEGMEERMKEARLAEDLLERELESYSRWIRGMEVQPTIVELRRHFHKVAEDELRKQQSRLETLDQNQHRMISGLVSSVLNKLLHSPTVTLKRALQDRDGSDLVAHTRRLFNLSSPGTEGASDGPSSSSSDGASGPAGGGKPAGGPRVKATRT
jgi:glutamyl-tRNA reductase